MAISLNFLKMSANGASGLKDIMSKKSSAGTQNVQQQDNQNKTQGEQKENLTDMTSSDLLKYVYNNTASKDNNDIKLPANLEYKDMDFAVNGKSFDDTVKEIADKTGDSTSTVESELKKKYAGGQTGTSLNMQA